MNSERPTKNEDTDPSGDPFWVTSQFSTRELDNQLVAIQWMSGKRVVNRGIYRIHMGSYGHSRHIQAIHVTCVAEDACEPADFDLDQADADLLHRCNESPKEYSFAARLEVDRKREHNPILERIVRERRERKLQDQDGGEPWEIVSDPVLKLSAIHHESWMLSEELESDNT